MGPALLSPVPRWVALCLVALATAWGVWTYVTITNEGDERADQFCTQVERDHLATVKRLKQTYEFLDSVTPGKKINDPLARFVAQRSLPALEEEARTDPAPPVCDEKGFGLPEPDPVIPDRPFDLRGPDFPPLPK